MAEKKCSKCKEAFNCCNEQRGCWCEGLTLTKEALRELKDKYDNCLCPGCLGQYSAKEVKI
jgi:hypothetical protein